MGGGEELEDEEQGTRDGEDWREKQEVGSSLLKINLDKYDDKPCRILRCTIVYVGRVYVVFRRIRHDDTRS